VREDLILTLKVFVSECTTASLDILPVADDRSLQIHKVGTKSQPDKQDSAQQEEKVELPIVEKIFYAFLEFLQLRQGILGGLGQNRVAPPADLIDPLLKVYVCRLNLFLEIAIVNAHLLHGPHDVASDYVGLTVHHVVQAVQMPCDELEIIDLVGNDALVLRPMLPCAMAFCASERTSVCSDPAAAFVFW